MKGFVAFIKAVGIGSLAAAAPVLLATIPIGLVTLSGEANPGGLLIMLSPLIFAVPIVLSASLLVGLPFTALLAWLGKERGEYYVMAGLICGAAPFLIWMLLPSGSLSFGIMAALGGFGGAVTGWRWGRYRDAPNSDRYAEM